MMELSRAEALHLLGSVSLGRIVFTQDALPTLRPVNHVLDRGQIVIRTHLGAALTLHTSTSTSTSRAGSGGSDRSNRSGGVVVAYEADNIDLDTHLGWSVIVTGYAHQVTDPDDLSRYEAILEPWVDQSMDHAVRIRPDLVTGFRLTTPPELDEQHLRTNPE